MSVRSHRSLLFVPGDRPERFDKALSANADGVIIDLEDAVAPERKAFAREALAEALRAGAEVLVRVNGPDTDDIIADLAVCAGGNVRGILLPKAESSDQIRQLLNDGLTVPLLPIIETARGYRSAESIAQAQGVARLVFGTLDFQLDLDIQSDAGDALLMFRSGLVLASRLAGLPAPIDGVTVELDDPDRLQQDIERGRCLGFGGKLCIHPRQIEAVNEGFGVSAADVDWARRVIEAIEQSDRHAVSIDGRMVDAPVIERARRILVQSADSEGR